ncbi:MAG: hypothetical protein IBJ14_10535 [Hydrogenophaga sp.]|nr:hypothetical protein [Hydrogenophaga sp.]
MNHALSVYTVIYVAILFVTVSIWGGDMKDARGDALYLLITQGMFSLKLAIDDYVHFQNPDATEEARHRDLWFSLFMYLFLAASIANAAMDALVASKLLFALTFLVGLVWLILNKPVDGEVERKRRHIGWLTVNGLCVLLLTVDAFIFPAMHDTGSRWVYGFLALLIAVDFVYFGTLRRLAALKVPVQPGAGAAEATAKAETTTARTSTSAEARYAILITLAWVALLSLFAFIGESSERGTAALISFDGYRRVRIVLAVILLMVAAFTIYTVLRHVSSATPGPWYRSARLVALVAFWAIALPTWFFVEYLLFDSGRIGLPTNFTCTLPGFANKTDCYLQNVKTYAESASRIWAGVGVVVATLIASARH